MEYIQKFFAFLVDFTVFSLTGKTIRFATMFDGLQTFFTAFDELHNIFAWANALLPVELIRVLLVLIWVVLLLKHCMNFIYWLIDVITL